MREGADMTDTFEPEPPPFQPTEEWIDAFRRLWTERLDALEAHLDGRSR